MSGGGSFGGGCTGGGGFSGPSSTGVESGGGFLGFLQDFGLIIGREALAAVAPVGLSLVLNLVDDRRRAFGGGAGRGFGCGDDGGVAEMWDPSESESESMEGARRNEAESEKFYAQFSRHLSTWREYQDIFVIWRIDQGQNCKIVAVRKLRGYNLE